MKQLIIFTFSILLLAACGRKDANTQGKHPLTPEMAAALKESMKKDLTGSNIQKTNDLDKYCDCIIKKLQSDFTSTEIMEVEFTDSKKYKKAQATCLENTKIN